MSDCALCGVRASVSPGNAIVVRYSGSGEQMEERRKKKKKEEEEEEEGE